MDVIFYRVQATLAALHALTSRPCRSRASVAGNRQCYPAEYIAAHTGAERLAARRRVRRHSGDEAARRKVRRCSASCSVAVVLASIAGGLLLGSRAARKGSSDPNAPAAAMVAVQQ